jgi:transposase
MVKEHKSAIARDHQMGGVRIISQDEEAEIREILKTRLPEEFGLDYPCWTRVAVHELFAQKYGAHMSLSSVTNYMHRWDFKVQRPHPPASMPKRHNGKIKETAITEEAPRIDKRHLSAEELIEERKQIARLRMAGYTHKAIAKTLGWSSVSVGHVLRYWQAHGCPDPDSFFVERRGWKSGKNRVILRDKDGEKRRKTPRIPMPENMKISITTGKDKNSLNVEVLDMSAGGLLMATNKNHVTAQTFNVVMDIYGRKCNCKANVVYKKEQNGTTQIGCAFMGMSRKSLLHIRRALYRPDEAVEYMNNPEIR